MSVSYPLWWSRLVLVAALVLSVGVAGARELPDFTHLVEANSPAVVNISTTQKVKRPSLPPGIELPDFPQDSPWGDLFRHFFGEGEGIEEYDATSLGSGVIIDKNGFILTNHHVVKDADEILVRLSDRRELPAKVIGSDERSDVALLKIDAQELPVVRIGRSEDLKVGEWVLAIGSPFGFDHSVSVGVVSALGRSLPRENYVPFIQTDVAINPGNSGGPLFNLDGQVVGINSQIYSRTGGFMGLSFAIPIDIAMDVAEQIKTQGHVRWGWLGILIQDVNRQLAESFGMEKPMGAVVLQVLPDSPAEQAGLKVGDVIVAFDGRPINHSSDLPVAVGRTPVGSEAKLSVIREGRRIQVSAKVGELPEQDVLAKRDAPTRARTDSRLGLAVDDIGAEQRERLKVERGGVLVDEVVDGPAAAAGIRKGDVIVMVANQAVKNARHFRELVEELPGGKPVPVLIQRDGSPVFVAVSVPEK